MLNFIPEKVRQLNDLESSAFNFVLAHIEAVQQMTVRDFAQQVHVSTATVMRMTAKLGFAGWSDFRYYLRSSRQMEEIPANYFENLLQLDIFLRTVSEESYRQKLLAAVNLIRKARYTVFIGLGTSGALADYGARYFSNVGLQSYSISDPFQTIKGIGAPDVLTIFLSASGETEEIVKRLVRLREEETAQILSITNQENNSVAKLSDVNLAYHFQTEYSSFDPLENLTSQLPVVALIEILAHQATENQEQ